MKKLSTIIRISSNISPTCVKWINNKEELIKKCFNSYLGASIYNDIENIFLLDNCPQYFDYFSRYGKVIETQVSNKRKTIEIMYQEALKCDSGAIFFLEDDYFWRHDVNISSLIEACYHFGAVTPYDHPLHYHSFNPTHLIRPFNNELWRHNLTTTHTFMVTKGILQRNFEEFNYGLHDWIMWTKLSTKGVELYAPINSYATHLAEGNIAYNYDFESLYKEKELCTK